MAYAVEILRDEGRRITRQRRLVMEVLEQNRGHLDAAMVYAKARARDARISLPTVYRSLALLKQIGLADGLSLGEDHAHFEAVRKSPHHHFACLRCGRVVEFDAPELNGLMRRLAARDRLKITDARVLLQGYCHTCRHGGG